MFTALLDSKTVQQLIKRCSGKADLVEIDATHLPTFWWFCGNKPHERRPKPLWHSMKSWLHSRSWIHVFLWYNIHAGKYMIIPLFCPQERFHLQNFKAFHNRIASLSYIFQTASLKRKRQTQAFRTFWKWSPWPGWARSDSWVRCDPIQSSSNPRALLFAGTAQLNSNGNTLNLAREKHENKNIPNLFMNCISK